MVDQEVESPVSLALNVSRALLAYIFLIFMGNARDAEVRQID